MFDFTDKYFVDFPNPYIKARKPLKEHKQLKEANTTIKPVYVAYSQLCVDVLKCKETCEFNSNLKALDSFHPDWLVFFADPCSEQAALQRFLDIVIKEEQEYLCVLKEGDYEDTDTAVVLVKLTPKTSGDYREFLELDNYTGEEDANDPYYYDYGDSEEERAAAINAEQHDSHAYTILDAVKTGKCQVVKKFAFDQIVTIFAYKYAELNNIEIGTTPLPEEDREWEFEDLYDLIVDFYNNKNFKELEKLANALTVQDIIEQSSSD